MDFLNNENLLVEEFMVVHTLPTVQSCVLLAHVKALLVAATVRHELLALPARVVEPVRVGVGTAAFQLTKLLKI